MRQSTLLFLLVIIAFCSCRKKGMRQCSVPYYRIPVRAFIASSSMDGLDTIFIDRYDTGSGLFNNIAIYTADQIVTKDSMLGVSYNFWEGNIYQLRIPGRRRSWSVSDFSFGADTVIYYESYADEPCHPMPIDGRLKEPESFKVNGVEQESRVINIDR